MDSLRAFFQSHSSEIIVGLVSSIMFGILVWSWGRCAQCFAKRAERAKLLNEFAISALNFTNNMPRWLGGNPDTSFVLFPQGPKGISKTIGPMVIDHVGKLQAQIMRELLGFNALLGFSKCQRDRMMELHDRLGQVGAAIKYYGKPVLWDQPTADRTFDVEYVRSAWADLAPLIQHKKDHRDSAFLRMMSLRFRFFPFLCPMLPVATLPPRTDSKGIKVMEYFGPIDPEKKSVA